MRRSILEHSDTLMWLENRARERKNSMKTDSALHPDDLGRMVHHCLYTDEEVSRLSLAEGDNAVPVDSIRVEGPVTCFAFHPGRLEESKPELAEMIRQVPSAFMFGAGQGGHSIAMLHVTREGRAWGQHRDIERLCLLAIAANFARWCMPKPLWPSMPGGMPYIQFAVPEAGHEFAGAHPFTGNNPLGPLPAG